MICVLIPVLASSLGVSKSMAQCKALVMNSWSVLVSGVILLVANPVFSSAIAQDVASTASVDDIIAQLESGSFVERELATEALIEIGETAVERLSNIPKTASFEVRQRGEIVAQRVAARVFEQRSSKFLRDLDPNQSYGLPAWHTFRQHVGSTRTSKLLYLEMLKHARDLANLVDELEQVQQSSTAAKDASAKQEALFVLASRKAENLQSRLFSFPTPEVGESISVLFASAVLDEMAPVEVNRVVVSVSEMSFHGYLSKPGFSQCIKKLLSAWIPKTNVALAPEVMRLAIRHELPVIAPIARQNIAPNFDVSTRALAFQCLATFGDESDVARLLEYTDETTIVEQFSESVSGITVTRAAPPGIPFIPGQDNSSELNNRIVRINDLAAVSAMLLLDEDPAAIFQNYSQEKVQRIYLHDLAIAEQDSPDRVAQIRAWAEARAK